MKNDLEIQDGKKYTIIFYEHPKIIESLKVFISLTEHIYCYSYILEILQKLEEV